MKQTMIQQTQSFAAHPRAFVAPSLDHGTVVAQRRSIDAHHHEARTSGYAAGYAAGLEIAETDVAAAMAHHRSARDRLVSVTHSLEAAVRGLAARDAVALGEIEADVLELAIGLATEILGRELACTTEPVREALARAFQLKPDRGAAVVRVHPDDVGPARDELDASSQWRGDFELVGDVRVEPGGCVLDVGDCTIDAQVSSALTRLRTALGATSLHDRGATDSPDRELQPDL
jgi:flagellar assembly protein FliH